MVDCELALKCKLVTYVNGGIGQGVRNEDRTERMIAVVAKNVRFPDSSTRQECQSLRLPFWRKPFWRNSIKHHSTIEEKSR